VAAPGRQRFEGLEDAAVTSHRALYFSEDNVAQHFFITVDGAKPQLFDPNKRPAVTTTQGAVEDWTIENRTRDRRPPSRQILRRSECGSQIHGSPIPSGQ
jgi:hypothetical protein